MRCAPPLRCGRNDAPASSGARASVQKAAIGAAGNDGGNNAVADNQRTLAPDADRLLDLVNRITADLPALPEGSSERADALASLRNIRYVLARHDYSP